MAMPVRVSERLAVLAMPKSINFTLPFLAMWNVSLSETKNGKVKLMDFGIAKTANLSLTRTGMAMGTPYYMAPEQVAGRATTPLVDIYAFGMLFYELLTGVRGVQGDTMEQLFYQIINVPLDPCARSKTPAPRPPFAILFYAAPQNCPSSVRKACAK